MSIANELPTFVPPSVPVMAVPGVPFHDSAGYVGLICPICPEGTPSAMSPVCESVSTAGALPHEYVVPVILPLLSAV